MLIASILLGLGTSALTEPRKQRGKITVSKHDRKHLRAGTKVFFKDSLGLLSFSVIAPTPDRALGLALRPGNVTGGFLLSTVSV